MDVIYALVEPVAIFAIFGGMLLVCLYGWFTSEVAYRGRPSSFSWDKPKPTDPEQL